MGRYIAQRFAATMVVLAVVSLISFSIMQMVPGDPAIVMAGLGASGDQVQRIREQFGLDQPFLVQLGRWYGGLLVGDLGQSITLARPVAQALIERVPTTLAMAVLAMALTIVLGIGAGVLAALRRDTWVDRAVMAAAVLGVSVPSFWLGLIFIIVFGVMLDLLPTGGYAPLGEGVGPWLRSLILPSVSLALLQIGLLARITRSAMVDVLQQDYMRTARAKGLPDWVRVGKHAFINVLVTVVTVIGIIFGLMLSGSVVIETVFALPGVGRLMASAILTRDYPVIQGGLLATAAVFVLLNLLVDILYCWIDPRIRYA
ncbi:MAG: ABC transporter permease [Alphaproteobacteria bacterium]|nr:ABC transporter permease [Alphaproteobacteria bacterium]